jgi:hypothetical protein
MKGNPQFGQLPPEQPVFQLLHVRLAGEALSYAFLAASGCLLELEKAKLSRSAWEHVFPTAPHTLSQDPLKSSPMVHSGPAGLQKICVNSPEVLGHI